MSYMKEVFMNTNSIVPLSRPTVGARIKSRHRGVQATRRNTRSGQPGSAPRTLPHKKRGSAAIERTPIVGTRDTTAPSFLRGGLARSARSNSRSSRQQQVYDPLPERHVIPAVKVPNLMELIVDDANFLAAINSIKSEPGKAPGCDGKTVMEVCQPLIESAEAREEVRRRVLTGQYRPAPIRTVLIPKANSDKMRTLGIATVMDRIVQTMIRQAVMNNLPADPWSKYSFAYLPKRGVAEAIAEVNRIREEGFTYAISLDLEAFFDNVPHDRLIAKLRKHIADDRVVRLAIAFLTPIVVGKQGSRTKNRLGTPQGSVLSPWLASMLYLDELDQEMTRRSLRFVRYADDVTIFCRSIKAARRVQRGLIRFLEGTMRCPVNRDKTKITGIESLSLLGVYLKKDQWHIDRKKLLQLRSDFRWLLEKYAKTRDELFLDEAISKIGGNIAHYSRIPNIAAKEVRALKGWAIRQWNTNCTNSPEKYRRWFLRVVNP